MVTLFFEAADVVTDGLACSRLLRGEIAVSVTDTYKVVYIVILCLGVVATGFSVGYRIQNARWLKTSMKELDLLQDRYTVSDSQLQQQKSTSKELRRQKSSHRLGDRQQHDLRWQAQQHEWELAQTHRTKVATTLEVLSILLQGACAVVRHC